MTSLSEPAPAKLNLALHVRARLPDGRHAIETLFAFCTDGDRVEGEEAATLTLECVGPFGSAIDGDNLVLGAARALQSEAAVKAGARLRLTKNLPVASGIGGGSADAAAVYLVTDILAGNTDRQVQAIWAFLARAKEIGAGPWMSFRNPVTGTDIVVKDVIADGFVQKSDVCTAALASACTAASSSAQRR